MMFFRYWIRQLFDKGWSQSTSLPLAASIGLQVGLVFTALVSLNPYFIWSHQKLYYAIATLILLVSYAGCFRSLALTREHLFLSVAFSLFLLYISILPKVHGGTTRWFFLIPFTVALLTVGHSERQRALEMFYWIFALSLVPGIILWICLAAGIPLEFRYLIPPYGPFADVTKTGIYYLELPGVLFLNTNMMMLPNGGIVFRLCGIYDEPGTVGTIAALCLAATRFRFRDFRDGILLIAGLMSFSIAFAVLTLVGCIAISFASRRPWLVIPAVLSATVGAIPLSGLEWKSDQPLVSNVTVLVPADKREIFLAGQLSPDKNSESSTVLGRLIVGKELRLRPSTAFDNRAMPEMHRLFTNYLHSSAKAHLFGLGSDASIVYGGASSSWTSILTNYGIIGFTCLFLLFLTPLVYLWRAGQLDTFVVIFCTLFLMSFYQRPVIWLPAQMLLFFSGLYYVESSHFRPNPNKSAE